MVVVVVVVLVVVVCVVLWVEKVTNQIEVSTHDGQEKKEKETSFERVVCPEKMVQVHPRKKN